MAPGGVGGVTATFDAYATDRTDARFTDWLRARSEPDWTDAVEHRFVHELADGTVDDAVFRRYLVQDYAFVWTLTGVFGYAVRSSADYGRQGLVDRLPRDVDRRGERLLRAFV